MLYTPYSSQIGSRTGTYINSIWGQWFVFLVGTRAQMLLGEELDITQIPMYLSPSKKLHEAILFRCRDKYPPARKEQLPGCRKCCMKTSSSWHLFQSRPQLRAPITEVMPFLGMVTCHWLVQMAVKLTHFSPVLDLWWALLALELPAMQWRLCCAHTAVHLLPLPSSASTLFIPQMLIPKKDHAPQDSVSIPASAEAKQWWGLSE